MASFLPMATFSFLNYHEFQKASYFCFHNNFSNSGPIFVIFFTIKIQKGSAEEAGIKTTTSPNICCRTTLRNVSGQLYSDVYTVYVQS